MIEGKYARSAVYCTITGTLCDYGGACSKCHVRIEHEEKQDAENNDVPR